MIFYMKERFEKNILFPRPNATEEELLAAVEGAYVKRIYRPI